MRNFNITGLIFLVLFTVCVMSSCDFFSRKIIINKECSIVAYNNNIYNCYVVFNNKIIIHPNVTSFWGEYPYLYGQAFNQNDKSYYFFLLNVENGIIVTSNVHSELIKLGIKPFGGYEQISFAEYFSKDDNVERERIVLFKKKMHLE